MMDRMRSNTVPVVNYGFLDGVVQAKNGYILPSDIDGIVETNRHFLVLEWKRPGEQLSKGQGIMLARLAELPRFTVCVVTGHSTMFETVVEDIYQLVPGGDITGTLRKIGNGVETLKELYKHWFNKSRATYSIKSVTVHKNEQETTA